MANKSDNLNLNSFWNKNVGARDGLVYLTPLEMEEGAKERHMLFGLLTMAIVHFFWNGFKMGRDTKNPLNSEYPLNAPMPQYNGSEKYFYGDYVGHNIAAIAVNFDGDVIDFEMNHNQIFNSSLEHAEARLIRRIFSLASLADTWQMEIIHKKAKVQDKNDYNTFEDITIYTSLESCAQCSGIMALAHVKNVVYLQTDPSMYLIGNILRNLTHNTKLEAPKPIDGDEIAFPYYQKLNAGFKAFKESGLPFFNDVNKKNKITTDSITAFLCTNEAYKIYCDATLELYNYFRKKKGKELSYGDFKPTRKDIKTGKEIQAKYSNKQVLDSIRKFYKYVIVNGRRATPHK